MSQPNAVLKICGKILPKSIDFFNELSKKLKQAMLKGKKVEGAKLCCNKIHIAVLKILNV